MHKTIIYSLTWTLLGRAVQINRNTAKPNWNCFIFVSIELVIVYHERYVATSILTCVKRENELFTLKPNSRSVYSSVLRLQNNDDNGGNAHFSVDYMTEYDNMWTVSLARQRCIFRSIDYIGSKHQHIFHNFILQWISHSKVVSFISQKKKEVTLKICVTMYVLYFCYRIERVFYCDLVPDLHSLGANMRPSHYLNGWEFAYVNLAY